jgi:hypothetical protein
VKQKFPGASVHPLLNQRFLEKTYVIAENAMLSFLFDSGK